MLVYSLLLPFHVLRALALSAFYVLERDPCSGLDGIQILRMYCSTTQMLELGALGDILAYLRLVVRLMLLRLL